MKNCLAFVFTLCSLVCLAQPTLEKLRFHSDAERLVFESFQSEGTGEVDFIKAFVHSSPEATEANANTALKEVEKIVAGLKQSGVLKKKPQKQAKAIFQQVHDAYFTVYEFENSFHHIFQDGRYNCVSATALYAVVLGHLNIGHVIKEQPNHVYLVGWPGNGQIILEGTDPQKGFFTINDRDKEKYVDQLLNTKSIALRDFPGMNKVEIYNSLASSSNKDIDLRMLLGLQYSNNGLYAAERGDYREALNFIEKSLWLYPRHVAAQAADELRETILGNITVPDSAFVEELVAWCRDTLNKNELDRMFTSYRTILDHELYNKTNWDRFHQWSRKLINAVEDSTVREELKYVYHYETARISYQQSRFGSSLQHIDTALAIKPQNNDLLSIFTGAFIGRIREMSDHREMISLLERFEENHPVLLQDVKVQSLKSEIYLRKAYTNLLTRNLATALEDVRNFEKTMEYGSPGFVSEELITQVFGEAVSLEFQRGRKQAAREMAERGLRFAPNSAELLARQAMLR